MAMIWEGGGSSSIEDIEERERRKRMEEESMRREAKYHKRRVMVERITDGTWHFFTSVYDLKYQRISTTYHATKHKSEPTVKMTYEKLYETISAEERTLRKLRDLPDNGKTMESCDQQSSNGSGTTITGP